MQMITEKDYKGERTVLRGNKFLIGNGYMGYRGTLEEQGKDACVGLNLAGLYDQVGTLWRETVNAPNPLYTTIVKNGVELLPNEQTILSHKIALSLDDGRFFRDTVYLLDGVRVRIRSERFASMAEHRLLISRYTVSTDKPCCLSLFSGIDSDVWNLNGTHLKNVCHSRVDGVLFTDSVTQEKSVNLSVALKLEYHFDAKPTPEIRAGRHGEWVELTTVANTEYTLCKYVAVCYGGDAAIISATLTSDAKLRGYNALLNEQKEVWRKLWKRSEVRLYGDKKGDEALRYSIYHLHILAPKGDYSIAARGLSGQTYKGAVFWDTEIFMLPFFLATDLDTAKRIVTYRICGLKGAREKAAYYGYSGAFYAWESQEDGFDACSDFNVTDVFTKRPVRTYFKDKQIHISGDVALSFWRYYDRTKDIAFLQNGGLEVILECARFFYSYSYFNTEKQRYELLDVMGADEYHERVNNNAFTNYLAKAVAEIAVKLSRELKRHSSDDAKNVINCCGGYKELDKIKKFARQLYLPQPNEDGVIEQFDGYFRHEDVTVPEVISRLVHPQEYFGGTTGVATATRVIKQADVIALLGILPHLFDEKTVAKNWDYYLPYTEHGSSLSACMYALTACRTGRSELAYPWFFKTATVDIDGNSKQFAGEIYIGGTHPAANGGAWMTAVMGFCGLSYVGNRANLSPCLPPLVNKITFVALDGGSYKKFTVTRDGVKKRKINEKN